MSEPEKPASESKILERIEQSEIPIDLTTEEKNAFEKELAEIEWDIER